MRSSIRFSIFVIVALFIGVGVARAAKAQEHPEHPAKSTEKATFDADAIGNAIQQYVDEDSALKGGYFLIYDPVSSSVLQLKLTKIHQDKLAKVGEGLYFACSDFAAGKDATYDLDFFLREKGDRLAVSEIKIHKENGNPRYNWMEKDGLWSTVPVK